MKESKSLQSSESTGSSWPLPANSPKRILVVEDDPDIRRLNADVLADSGYQVDVAGDGAVAWQTLQAKTYDLLITDNRMPTVTGLELIEKLRGEDMKLPVILTSGTMPTEELAVNPWLQIQATLRKPYTLAELLATVRNVLCVPAIACGQLAPPPNWQSPADS